MAAPRDIEVVLSVDTSKFVEGLAKAQAAIDEFKRDIGNALLPSLREAAIRVAEWFRVQASRDTRQVPCPSPVSHEVWFTTEGTKNRACPGCGAAI